MDALTDLMLRSVTFLMGLAALFSGFVAVAKMII